MPPLVPLSAAEIAELFGAINEFVGTGNNVATNYQLDYAPVVDARSVQDELIAFGDGVTTTYTSGFAPIQSGTFELHVGTVTGTALVDPADYSVNLLTGVVTLTPSGVTAITDKQLHAKYSAPSTLELHKTSITGPLLTPGTHYTVTPKTGAVVLTAAGVTFLGVDTLHAKYQIVSGLVNILSESNAGFRSSIAQMGFQVFVIDGKDDALKVIHETIEAKTIVHLESERRALQVPSAILVSNGNFLAAGQQVTETKIYDSIDQFLKLSVTLGPLYPAPSLSVPGPGVGNPRWLDAAFPRSSEGLDGGTGNDTANEQNQNSIEAAQYAAIIAAGPDTNPAGWLARFGDPATGIMLSAIAAQQTALATQIAALTAFLTDNPVANDHISAGDIADATAASAAASTRFSANATYVTSVTTPPHSGLQNSEISGGGTRSTATASRNTFITGTRTPQLTTLLTFLYGRRYFWISSRAAVGSGTLFSSINFTKSQVKSDDQIAVNNDKIDEILAILAAQ